MKILVGSMNPVKISSVKEAFGKYFEEIDVTGIEVESGVPDQPLNDETFIGAQNRAVSLKLLSDQKNLNADYFVGIEGGIVNQYGKWFAFGCMCVVDREGRFGFGLSPHFELPGSFIEPLLNRIELGELMDRMMNEQNSKQKQGAIGFFTNGVMNRTELYVEGLKTAIVPFLHPELFFDKGKTIAADGIN